MELAVFNITFLKIRGKNNVLADTISRLKALDITKNQWRTQNISSYKHSRICYESTSSYMHTVGITMLHTEQKWDIMCQN